MNYEEALTEAKRKLELHKTIEKSEPSVIEYDELVVKALKKQIQKEADGCTGCKHENKTFIEMPCYKCARGSNDFYTAKGLE